MGVGVSFEKYQKIERKGTPTSVHFECTKITEYNIGIHETREVRFKVGGKNDDEKRSIKFELNNANISLSTSGWKAENEWILRTKITGRKSGETIITVKVEGKTINAITVKCVDYKDVFLEEDVKRLKVEASTLGLSNTACINVADARISELLQDQTNFMNRNRQKMSHGEYTPRLQYLAAKGFVIGGTKEFRYNLNNNGDVYRPKDLKTSIKTYIENQLKSKIGYHVFYISMLNDVHVLTLLVNNNNPCHMTFEVFDQGTRWKTNGEQDLTTIDNYFIDSSISLYDWYLKAHKIQGKDHTRISKIKRL